MIACGERLDMTIPSPADILQPKALQVPVDTIELLEGMSEEQAALTFGPGALVQRAAEAEYIPVPLGGGTGARLRHRSPNASEQMTSGGVGEVQDVVGHENAAHRQPVCTASQAAAPSLMPCAPIGGRHEGFMDVRARGDGHPFGRSEPFHTVRLSGGNTPVGRARGGGGCRSGRNRARYGWSCRSGRDRAGRDGPRRPARTPGGGRATGRRGARRAAARQRPTPGAGQRWAP